jgi:hypothetical protein
MTIRKIRLRRERVEWREVDDELVVLDMEGSVYLSVNSSGKDLWAAVVAGATADDLAAILSGRYGRAPDDAQREVAAFVKSLENLGLVDAAASSPQTEA